MSALSLGIKIIRAFIPVLLIFFFSLPLCSQNLSDPSRDREQIFIARTKQFNEFTDRFNLKTNFNGNPVDSAFLSKMPRGKMISMLFDLKDPRIIKPGKDYSDDYVRIKESFINEVTGKKLEISKYSGNIIAEAVSRVIYKGEPRKISLFLVQETVGKDMVKWVIYSAKGDLLDVFEPDTSMIRFIPPSSNETDFMNFRRALEDTAHLSAYARNDFEPDKLTLFFSLVRSGELRFEYVESVIYHVIDIPGWYLKIRDFNRNELNSGWLITDISRNNLDRAEFIRNLQ